MSGFDLTETEDEVHPPCPECGIPLLRNGDDGFICGNMTCKLGGEQLDETLEPK